MRAARSEPLFPGSQLLHLVQVAARWGTDADAVLDRTGLTRALLEEPSTLVPLSTLIGVVERTRALCREPAIGVYAGLALRANHYGYLGFATMCAPTMRAALALAVRYVGVFTPAHRLALHESGGRAELVVDELVDFGSVRDVMVLSALIGLRTVGEAMTGRAARGRIELALPRPSYAARVEAAVPGVVFGQRLHRLVFDAELLDVPYLQHDPVSLRMFVDHCAEALDHTGLRAPLSGRVRALLRSEGALMPSLEQVAQRIGMSARTFKRRLAEEEASYRGLLDDELARRALELLPSELTLAQVASRLGYTNTGAFERAFRRWTGHTPAAYRRAHGW